MQYDGKPSVVESFHDNRTHRLVVGKEVEDSEEEEEAESQSVGKRDGNRALWRERLKRFLKFLRKSLTLIYSTILTSDYQ